MKRVVFFDSIGLAKKCLEEVVMKEDVELLGVCCTQLTSTWREDESVYTFSKKSNIPILSFEEVEELSPDIGFSVRYDKIIPQAPLILLIKEFLTLMEGYYLSTEVPTAILTL